MDLRAEPSGELHMMPYLLQRLVLVARAGGVEPIGAWWRAGSRGTLASPALALEAARRAHRHGLRGGLGVDASQVAPLNEGFTPTESEVAWARALVDAFEIARARRETRGTLDGQIVDWPRAHAARGVIARAEACRRRDESKRAAARGTGLSGA
jgi:citrate lyase subunit beta/citryl-CoA lyase